MAGGWTDFLASPTVIFNDINLLSSASVSGLPEVPEIPAGSKSRLIAFLMEEKKGRNSEAEMAKGWPRRKWRPKDQATDRNDVREGRSQGLPSKNRPPSRDSHAAQVFQKKARSAK